ncbi:EAL domain-containing protein [Arthrobacter sp. UYCu712]|uniref:sensor domain-containing phosphodiesterase n=1 Tax=Arthrobacter sp. UYCu712 TaxID=3156340 RepID=UPI003398AE91
MADREPGRPRVRDVLACVLAVQVVFALTAGAVLIVDPTGLLDHPGAQLLAALLTLMPIVMAGLLAWRFREGHRVEKLRAGDAAQLIDTVLSTSREWLWVVDGQGNFTFSSPTSLGLLGYSPSELVGNHCSLVIDLADLAKAKGVFQGSAQSKGRVVARCRHRDGSAVWMEAVSTARTSGDGQTGGFQGTSRLVQPKTAQEAAAARSRARIRTMIDGGQLLTAFQPIHSLAAGHVIGVEALSRFVGDDGAGPEFWFTEAAAVGLGEDLEFAALHSALKAAQSLPACVYVALNVSPASCLDPRLPRVFKETGVPLDRIVLELTERLEVSEYGPLLAVLKPLRQRGLRVAVDDAGSGFASMRHVLHIRPDIMKLDRSLITGIDDDQGQHALGAALAEFARQIGATLTAEGIETEAELSAVTGLGMTAGQGYFLGRPTVDPVEWATWHDVPHSSPSRDTVSGH